jgi:methylated-DNA-[protein]-cysteine S-methyltransferase
MLEQRAYTTIMPSPLGHLGLICQNGALHKLDFLFANNALQSTIPDTSLQHITAELTEYFRQPQHKFTIKFNVHGTPFQKKVWQALQAIPSGQTMTYGELAKELRSGPRAIGQACRTNPIPIIVPCHRIVAANHTGGYSGNLHGSFKEIKEWLLRHEKAS